MDNFGEVDSPIGLLLRINYGMAIVTPAIKGGKHTSSGAVVVADSEVA
jgi:hypothetical protein